MTLSQHISTIRAFSYTQALQRPRPAFITASEGENNWGTVQTLYTGSHIQSSEVELGCSKAGFNGQCARNMCVTFQQNAQICDRVTSAALHRPVTRCTMHRSV